MSTAVGRPASSLARPTTEPTVGPAFGIGAPGTFNRNLYPPVVAGHPIFAASSSTAQSRIVSTGGMQTHYGSRIRHPWTPMAVGAHVTATRTASTSPPGGRGPGVAVVGAAPAASFGIRSGTPGGVAIGIKGSPPLSTATSTSCPASPAVGIAGARQSTHPVFTHAIVQGGAMDNLSGTSPRTFRTTAGAVALTAVGNAAAAASSATAVIRRTSATGHRFGGEAAKHKAFLAAHPEARVTAVTERQGQEHVIGEYVVEHEVKVPKKTVREEVIERTYVVPERVLIEEIVEDTQTVRECIVEVAQPVIQERVVEVPEVEYVERVVEVPVKLLREHVREVPKVEYQERVVEVPKVVMKEKAVDVPVYEYHEVPVEKVVEVPEIHEEVVLKEIAVPQYIDKPVREERTVEVEQETHRRIPVPVEAKINIELVLPKIRPNYSKHEIPVYVPRFVEYPLQAEFCNEEMLDKADRASQEVARLMETSSVQPLSLCALEDTAGMVQNLEFERLVSQQNAVENFAYWWRLNKIDIDIESLKSVCQTVENDGSVVMEAVSVIDPTILTHSAVPLQGAPHAAVVTREAFTRESFKMMTTTATKAAPRSHTLLPPLITTSRSVVALAAQPQKEMTSEQMFPDMTQIDKKSVDAPLAVSPLHHSAVAGRTERVRLDRTADARNVNGQRQEAADEGEMSENDPVIKQMLEGERHAAPYETDEYDREEADDAVRSQHYRPHRGEHSPGEPPAFGSSPGSSAVDEEAAEEEEINPDEMLDDAGGLPEVTFIDEGHPSLYTAPSANQSDP